MAPVTITSSAQLGAVIREHRKQLGLRQQETALAAGVGVRFLSELENGKPTVRLQETLAVLAALGITLSAETPVA